MAELACRAATVSTIVRSTNGVPVIVERSMWWPAAWREGHAAGASPLAGTKWAIADGQVVPYSDWTYFNTETYALASNTSPRPADLTLTFVFEDGRSLTRQVTVAAMSRRNFAFRQEFPENRG